LSLFNIKGRCCALGISVAKLFDETKKRASERNSKFDGVTYEMFSNMHRGRYNYGIGPEFISIANEILQEWEQNKA